VIIKKWAKFKVRQVDFNSDKLIENAG
jgi:hypothetical protein